MSIDVLFHRVRRDSRCSSLWRRAWHDGIAFRPCAFHRAVMRSRVQLITAAFSIPPPARPIGLASARVSEPQETLLSASRIATRPTFGKGMSSLHATGYRRSARQTRRAAGVAQNLDRLNFVSMSLCIIAHADALFVHVFCQRLRHALGQHGYTACGSRRQPTLRTRPANRRPASFHGANSHLRVGPVQWTNDLFVKTPPGLFDSHPLRAFAETNTIAGALDGPFLELQRDGCPYKEGRRETRVQPTSSSPKGQTLCTCTDLRTDTWDSSGKNNGVVRNEFEQGGGRFARWHGPVR